MTGDAGMHFERMPEVYRRARPPYPDALYERLIQLDVLAPGRRVLEIGAGTGQATSRLVQNGASVTALEPGAALAALLAQEVPDAAVLVDTFENAVAAGQLSDDSFDSVCVATAFHWLEPEAALPEIQRLLVPSGLLAVWRHVFGDPSITTPFRERLAEVVARREDSEHARQRHRAQFDWSDELTANNLFERVHHEHFRWSVDLTRAQIHDLFSTFSDWQPHEVDELAATVDELGGTVTEHYGTTLAIVRSTR